MVDIKGFAGNWRAGSGPGSEMGAGCVGSSPDGVWRRAAGCARKSARAGSYGGRAGGKSCVARVTVICSDGASCDASVTRWVAAADEGGNGGVLVELVELVELVALIRAILARLADLTSLLLASVVPRGRIAAAERT